MVDPFAATALPSSMALLESLWLTMGMCTSADGEFILSSLENGISLGLVRPMDPRIVSWAVLGSIKQLVEVLIEKRERDLRAMAAALVDYNLAGLLA